MVNRLVALSMPGGHQFVEAVQRVWDEGDAVLPVDQRLPKKAQLDLIAQMGASAVLDPSGASSLDGWPVEPGDALVVATSGSTGQPKGVVLEHGALIANAEATNAFLGVDPVDDKWLACLPLSHVGGFSVIVRALHCGAALEVHDGFEADRVMSAAHGGVTLVSLVPTAMRRIDTDLFRKVLVGGSSVPSDRADNVVATYGMTETGSGVVYNGYPLENVELRIVEGQVQIRCPMLFRCYRNGDNPNTRDGWYPTGDAGELDSEGVLTVHGRMGDMIITGGENVWPVTVERILSKAAGVRECAVVGRPDAEWGQSVVALVVPSTVRPSLAELRELVKDSLPAYCAPRSIEFVEQLPKTSLGKLQRHLL
ncbi:MAG: AMP-dependent synthetase [Acidimicrobiales bacterium MED-G01]|nr:MAG: AMP-dependent synthetase [Acidimicrobiales bacterium MED-G01]